MDLKSLQAVMFQDLEHRYQYSRGGPWEKWEKQIWTERRGNCGQSEASSDGHTLLAGQPKRGSSGSAAARKMSMKSPSWQEICKHWKCEN